MIFKIFIFYLYLFTPILSKSVSIEEPPKLSVILFFAKLENLSEIPKEPQALKCVGLSERAKIKHDAMLNEETPANQKVSETPGCHELLKNSVMNLIHYGQDKLGMKTAIASVDPQHLTEAISNEEPQVAPELISETHSEKKARKSMFCPSSKKKEESIPAFVTKPKHTEVFNIRVKKKSSNRNKRDEFLENPLHHEIANVALEKRNDKPPWDVLDVVSHVRYSFFKNVLGSHTSHQEAKDTIEDNSLSGEEQKPIIDEIGKKTKDPGLFQTVSSALATLQESEGEAFIMVVFGGHLNSISNPNSTIIVLTASCPEPPTGGEVVIQESTLPEEKLIPVFAKGPHSERFAECTDLDDVPLTVKNILKKNAEKNGKCT